MKKVLFFDLVILKPRITSTSSFLCNIPHSLVPFSMESIALKKPTKKKNEIWNWKRSQLLNLRSMTFTADRREEVGGCGTGWERGRGTKDRRVDRWVRVEISDAYMEWSAKFVRFMFYAPPFHSAFVF